MKDWDSHRYSGSAPSRREDDEPDVRPAMFGRLPEHRNVDLSGRGCSYVGATERAAAAAMKGL